MQHCFNVKIKTKKTKRLIYICKVWVAHSSAKTIPIPLQVPMCTELNNVVRKMQLYLFYFQSGVCEWLVVKLAVSLPSV